MRSSRCEKAESAIAGLRRRHVVDDPHSRMVDGRLGTADAVVDVSQSRRLAAVMQSRADFEYLEWDGGEHTPLSFPLNWIGESQDFLDAL